MKKTMLIMLVLMLVLILALTLTVCSRKSKENTPQPQTAAPTETVSGDPAEYSMEFWTAKYPEKNICPFYIEEGGTEKPYYLIMEMGTSMKEWIETPFNWNGWHMIGGDIVNKAETFKMTASWVGEDAGGNFSSFCTVNTEPYDASAAAASGK